MMPALPHVPLPRMQNESLLGELVNQAEPFPACYYFPPGNCPSTRPPIGRHRRKLAVGWGGQGERT